MIDLHTHHNRCGHAKGDIENYVQNAISRDFQVLGISDHAPLFAHEDDHPYPHIQMACSEFPHYVQEVQDLQSKYRDRLTVRLGLEADFIAGHETLYKDRLAEVPLDYVIGSVHSFGSLHVYQPNTWEAAPNRQFIYREYFKHVQMAAQSGLFDILGHCDAIKVFAPEVLAEASELIDETLEVIATSDIVVEINTSGIRKCGVTFPAPEIIAKLHDYGVALTYGSDAHAPEELGYGAQEVKKLLKSIGVKELMHFKCRERSAVAIDDFLQDG